MKTIKQSLYLIGNEVVSIWNKTNKHVRYALVTIGSAILIFFGIWLMLVLLSVMDIWLSSF